tara:strand:+ start:2458 stop:2664 length:207 start_codon:yes stop_codon:yes gene_type:complete
MSHVNGFKVIRKAVHDKKISNGKLSVGRNNKVIVEVYDKGGPSPSPKESLSRVIAWAKQALVLLEEEQ